jgi:hypothetical protein
MANAEEEAQRTKQQAEGAPQEAAETGRGLISTAVDGSVRARDRLATGLRKRPALGFVAAGGAGLALANALGVGEAALALATGYVAYQYLRHGRSPAESLNRLMPGDRGQQGV